MAAYTGQLDEIVVQGARQHSFGGVPIKFGIPYPQEQIWAIYDYDIDYLGSNNGRAANKGTVGQNSAKIQPGFTAIVHTHPSWAEYGPGPADFGLNVPLYGIAPAGVWVLMPGASFPIVLYGTRLH